MCQNSAAQKDAKSHWLQFVRLFSTLSFQMCRQIECPQVENWAECSDIYQTRVRPLAATLVSDPLTNSLIPV